MPLLWIKKCDFNRMRWLLYMYLFWILMDKKNSVDHIELEKLRVELK